VNATKERQAWCCLQVKLCDLRLSALSVVATIKALYKYTSFLSFPFKRVATLPCEMFVLKNCNYPKLSEANFHAILCHLKHLLKNITE